MRHVYLQFQIPTDEQDKSLTRMRVTGKPIACSLTFPLFNNLGNTSMLPGLLNPPCRKVVNFRNNIYLIQFHHKLIYGIKDNNRYKAEWILLLTTHSNYKKVQPKEKEQHVFEKQALQNKLPSTYSLG